MQKENTKPEWLRMKLSDMEKIVLELAKEGNGPEKIGLILRDKYGIPKAKLLGKKIKKILNENNIKKNSEKEILEQKIKKLEEHIQKNKHDYCAKRSIIKALWALRKHQA